MNKKEKKKQKGKNRKMDSKVDVEIDQYCSLKIIITKMLSDKLTFNCTCFRQISFG